MHYELSITLILLSNEVSFTIVKQLTFVLEGAAFEKVVISGGQDSNHKVEQQNTDDKQLQDQKNREYDLLILCTIVFKHSKSIVEDCSER